MRIKILFLYTEIAGYFIACINKLAERGVEVHLVHLPVNTEAPFVFFDFGGIQQYAREKYTANQLINLAKKISPDAIYCSGWKDRDYLKICLRFRDKIPVVLGFDNQWSGSIKQKAIALFSKTLLHKHFSHCWIPGKPQLEYAHRLKFNDSNILSGFYSCDYYLFHNLYLKYIVSKQKSFPHRFIFTGRYYDFKGIEDLWNAFIELQNNNPNDWELWCLGTGDITPVVHPKIKHFGFVQPNKIEKYIAETGVFVMPSRFEPWGVAVHEFAAAGFPLICSKAVGAAEMFLKNSENGFLFEPGNIFELKKILERVMSMPDKKLFTMGEKSAGLAEQITPDKWSDTLMTILEKK